MSNDIPADVMAFATRNAWVDTDLMLRASVVEAQLRADGWLPDPLAATHR